MIGLVLRHARWKILEAQLDLTTVPVERANRDVGVAGHHAADVGDAEAAFPPFFACLGVGDDFRVDHDGGGALAVRLVLEQCDEQAQARVDLRRCQSDPVVLVHGLEHVVDELLHHWIAEVALLDQPAALAEHGMPHPRDFQYRHERRL